MQSPEFYHDQVHNFLIYKPEDPDHVASIIPGTRNLAGGYVAVERTLYNCQLLRWIDLPVSPIMDHYDWPHNPLAFPSGAKCPTDVQKVMANFLALHARSFNLSDMGTMKTMAALWAADFVMSQYPPGECRCLIVSILSTLQRVWGDALFNHFLGRRTYQIVHHYDAEQRRKQLATPADFYIINPDGVKLGAKTKRRRFSLSGLSQDLYDRRDIKIVIADEVSRYWRDHRSGRHQVARVMFTPQRISYFWQQTGTPTPKAPTDAYGLALLTNDCYGESWTNYHRRTMVPVSKFKFVPARGSYLEAAKLLQPAVRFSIEDVWDGPECTTQIREVPLSDQQTKLLRQLKNELSVQVGQAQITPLNEAGVRTKALQIIQGAIYDKGHNSHDVDTTPRINETLDLIDEATRKTLIFVPLTNVVNLLCNKLQEEDDKAKKTGAQRYGFIKLNGSVSRKDRDSGISRFLSDDAVRVAVCDPETVASGINEFVAATTVVWYGPTDKAELYIQGNKRAHRPGQRFPVTIVQLVATTLEREIFRRLDNNQAMQGVMLDWIQQEKL